MNDWARATIALLYVPGELQQATLDACDGVQRLVERCRTPRDQPSAYARHLIALWRQPGDLILLEQDKVPPRGWFTELRRCPEDLCVFPYYSGDTLVNAGFGVVRFAADLKAFYSHAMERICTADGNGRGWRSWKGLDTRTFDWFARAGVDRHVHTPCAGHLHQLELAL